MCVEHGRSARNSPITFLSLPSFPSFCGIRFFPMRVCLELDSESTVPFPDPPFFSYSSPSFLKYLSSFPLSSNRGRACAGTHDSLSSFGPLSRLPPLSTRGRLDTLTPTFFQAGMFLSSSPPSPPPPFFFRSHPPLSDQHEKKYLQLGMSRGFPPCFPTPRSRQKNCPTFRVGSPLFRLE